LDISRQVFARSARMGMSYVVFSVLVGLGLTATFNFTVPFARALPNSPGIGNLDSLLGLMVVPFAAMVGLVITTPVYLLFVNDKNVGVLEYLLAVGMDQRSIFWGYLKAALLLSLVAIVPMVLLNTVMAGSGLATSLTAGALSLVTGASDVSLVTVLMTAYSSMQRKPTGMNSPIGLTIGVLLILPEFFLIAVVRGGILYVDTAVALGILAVSLVFLSYLDRLIKREKLLP